MRLQILPLLGLLSVAVPVGQPDVAGADWFNPRGDGWTTYVNERFGTRLDYPSHLFATEGAFDEGGFRFVSPDAALEVQAAENTSGETATEFRTRLLTSDRYDDVTYKAGGTNWFVLSGYRADQIFYEKYLFRGGVVHAFAVEFPRLAKPVYAPLVERMEDSFVVGPRDEAADSLSGLVPAAAKA